MLTRGIHLVADFWGCSRKSLEDEAFLRRLLEQAAQAAGTRVFKLEIHKFQPTEVDYSGGVTAFALLSESHITLHSFPESGYLSLDIYACGERSNPRAGYKFLKGQLQPKSVCFSELVRGEQPFQ